MSEAINDKPWQHLKPRGEWQTAVYVYGTHRDADRVLRAVYVWCAMAAACQNTSRMTCDRHEDTAEPVWSDSRKAARNWLRLSDRHGATE